MINALRSGGSGFLPGVSFWICLLGTAFLNVACADATKTGSVGTLIPPLTSNAATRQAEFSAKICETLGQARFEARTFVDPTEAGVSLRYRLLRPATYERTNLYPLVLFLHGGGAVRSFDDLLTCTKPVFAFGPARFASPEAQAKHPAFVLVPWSDSRGWSDQNIRLILALLGDLRREFAIDAKRIYVTGQSMGGFGTWKMITQHPDVFAAAVPVCGGGTPADAPRAKGVAVWAFHGTADTIVSPSNTREMIAALLKAGGRPTYWEYEGGTHAKTAERAYCEPQLLDWLLDQRQP